MEKLTFMNEQLRVPWAALLGPDSKDNEELICKHAWFNRAPCGERGCSNNIKCVKGK